MAEAREGRLALRSYPRIGGLRVLQKKSGESLVDAIVALRASGRYEFVEKDPLRFRRALPNDPRLTSGEQWHLRNTGRDGGKPGADINATAAWDVRSAAPDVIVAVMDTGVRETHEDLAANLWRNSGEIPGNNLDDDHNGYIDDVHGINALAPPGSPAGGNPVDDVGHGTAIAGLIGAVGNNGTGATGVAWKVQIMSLKFDDAEGANAVSDMIECIDYALAHNARVINFSYGGFTYSQAEYAAIAKARDAGVIFVTAAGNYQLDIETYPDYPSAFLLDNILVVTSTDRQDVMSGFSNYGSGMVELAAPGTDILSTNFASDAAYASLDGTSFSAPLVVGACALVKTHFPAENHRQVINRLLRGVDSQPSLLGKVQTGGRLNVARALTGTSNRPFNDNFTDRPALTGAAVAVRARSEGATVEPGERAHAGVSAPEALWWAWTPSRSGQAAVEASGGSAGDTFVAIYTGSDPAALTLVTENDDFEGAKSSQGSFFATAGTTYQIAAGVKSGTAGSFTLRLGFKPDNDAFAGAIQMTGPSFRVAGFNTMTAGETGEPRAGTGAQSRSVWYRWMAPQAGEFSLSVFAHGFDAIVAVYTGSSLETLAKVATGSLEYYNETASFTARLGQAYYFQVDSLDERTGFFDLTLINGYVYPGVFPAHPSPAYSPATRTMFTVDTYGFVLFINDATIEVDYTELDGTLDVHTPAVAAEGAMFIGDEFGYAHAFKADTTRWWKKDLGAVAVTSSVSIGSDGAVYFHTDDGYLHGYYADGTPKWRVSLPGESYSSPSFGPDGTLYVGSSDEHLYAFSPVDGALKWKYRADGGVYASPAVDLAGNLYFGTLGGKFHAVTRTGSLLWSYPTGGAISSSAAIGVDGTLYFGSYDTHVYALTADGQLRWKYPTGDEIRGSSPAIDVNGVVYIGSYDGLLYAIKADGTLKQTYATGSFIRSSPMIVDGVLVFGSGDNNTYLVDIGGSLSGSSWPMHRQNVRRTGRRAVAVTPTVTVQPRSQSATNGGSTTIGIDAQGGDPLTFQWSRNGIALAGATNSVCTIDNVTAANAGVYTVAVNNPLGSAASTWSVVGPAIAGKVSGTGSVVGHDILHPNGNIFDQILLEGAAASFTADNGQITRMSFVDTNDDIVQVEFSGPGTLSLVLENMSGPTPPVNYNQAVTYMKGRAGIVITGATESTHVSVFSVGRANAVNQALFRSEVAYDGRADFAYLAIQSANGRFGSLRTANASYAAGSGLTGVMAPGVEFTGPVFIGNISASGSATPCLILGAAGDVRITGGDLHQANAAAVQIEGIEQLRFTGGSDSHGNLLGAKPNRARLVENGQDVTARVVINPGD